MGDEERAENDSAPSQVDQGKSVMIQEVRDGATSANEVACKQEQSVLEVQMPKRKSTIHKFLDSSKEMLCPEDPFRQFRHQSRLRRCALGIKYMLPILEWGPKYSFSFLKADIIAGATIASIAIPQGIAYARLASLPPIIGLYSSFLPPLLYALFGSSRDLAIGPGSILSILLGTLLRQEVDQETSPDIYVRLAFSATFFAGVFQAALGAFRLGFILDFLSHAAVVGFLSGAALVIALQQLEGILNIVNFTKKSDIASVMHSVWAEPEEWSWRTSVFSICILGFLLVTREISKRRKNLFWLAAIAQLVSVIFSTLLVFMTHAEKHSVDIVGHLKQGLNPVSAGQLYLHGPLAVKSIKTGLVTGMISLVEAIAVGRTFATLKDYQIDGNKEMIALGVVNLGSSFMSCYVTTGAVCRSAVNYRAGCKTAFSNIVMAVIIMITLLALTPLFYYTPDFALATIILAAVLGLIDFQGMHYIWKVDRLDFLVCMGAFLGVIFISIPLGLLIAVAMSLARLLLNISRPHTAILGRVSGTNIYQDMKHYSNCLQVPGILLIRIDTSICFPNSNYVKERILRWVIDEEEVIKKTNGVPLKYIILDLAPVMSIDTTGLLALLNIRTVLKRKGLQLGLASPGTEVLEKLMNGNFFPSLGETWLFPTLCQAVQACSMAMKEIP